MTHPPQSRDTGGEARSATPRKREKCSKKACNRASIVVVKLYTTEGPNFMAFCETHLHLVAEILEGVADDLNKQRARPRPAQADRSEP